METRQIRRYRHALRLFERLVQQQLKCCSCGVSFAQCLVMLELDEHERLTMGELAAHLRLDHTTLSRTVDNLVRKDLVVRQRDGEDRRVVWVYLTETGTARCREIHAQSDAFCESVLDRIPRGEREAVIGNFEILVDAYLEQESSAASC
jgi:DNA-binding MarR family transcriptional regulator